MSNTTYPSNPIEVPRNLVQLSSAYKTKTILAIASIVLFFVLYVAMIVGLGYLVRWAIFYDMVDINKLTILLKIGAIAGSVMLFVFSFKFLFKLKNVQPTNRIKVDVKNHPELKEFIDKVCRDTAAPKPKSVYLDPDVNAYVSYTNSWQSLIFPTKKDLTIGVGIIETLNLSEFKAVIAHEFGHFAQRSMKIGSYIMSANTIIHDMIYSRDYWDETLDKWRASDIRIAFAAWIITPVIWLIRTMLSLFYRMLNLAYSSLSREMEFNADKVAVGVSGSDAIISALWKLDAGFASWNQTLNYAYNASMKQQFAKNLYVHNSIALEKSNATLDERYAALPDHKRGGKEYFTGDENAKIAMYASHPPNNHREESAKFPYVTCLADDRSPWVLFNEVEDLQEQLTAVVYREYFGAQPREFVDETTLQQFISAEEEGSDLLEMYHHTFRDRFLMIPDDLTSSSTGTKTTLDAIKGELQELMKPIVEYDKSINTAGAILGGTSSLKSFSYDGVEYKKSKVEEGYHKVVTDRQQYMESAYTDWDARFARYCVSSSDNSSHSLALLEQHRNVVKIFKSIADKNRGIHESINKLQAKSDATQYEVGVLSDEIKHAFAQINAELEKICTWDFVPLSNIESNEELLSTILPDGEVFIPRASVFEHQNFDRMMQSLQAILNNLQRVDQKSIAKILAEVEGAQKDS